MNPGGIDMYGPIHKTLRQLLSSFIGRAGATDWDDTAAVASLKPDWAFIVHDLHVHHEMEERHVHPLLARGAPGGARAIEEEHKEHLATLDDLDRHFRSLADGEPPADRRAALGREFVQALNLLYARILTHMYREDVEAQRVLESTCSQEELHGAMGAIIGSLAPADLLELVAVMFPAISLPERAEVLGGIRAGAPPQAFAVVADRVRSALGEPDWTVLATRIGA